MSLTILGKAAAIHPHPDDALVQSTELLGHFAVRRALDGDRDRDPCPMIGIRKNRDTEASEAEIRQRSTPGRGFRAVYAFDVLPAAGAKLPELPEGVSGSMGES